MLKFNVVCLYFAVVAVNFWTINCFTAEEKKDIMKAMEPLVKNCATDCGMAEEDFKQYEQVGDIEPCFKKCMLQKMGVLDKDGKYDKDAMQDSISEYPGDKDEARRMQDKLDSCFAANGDNNGDDEASQIKRVDVLFQCFKDIEEAITETQKSGIQRELVTLGLQCIKDHPLSLSDIRAFKNKMIPNGNDPKCFVACLFKKIGVMDNMGMISPAKARENAKKVFKGSDEHLKDVDEIMEKCSAVNHESTNDGKKGCDRAKLAFGCFAENAPKYGFDFDF